MRVAEGVVDAIMMKVINQVAAVVGGMGEIEEKDIEIGQRVTVTGRRGTYK